MSSPHGANRHFWRSQEPSGSLIEPLLHPYCTQILLQRDCHAHKSVCLPSRRSGCLVDYDGLEGHVGASANGLG